MAADSLKLLEFPELLSLVGGYVGSPLGKANLPSLAPCGDLETITARQQLAAEAGDYLRSSMAGAAGQGTGSRTLPIRFSDFTDPARILDKVAIEGTVLEISEIAELLDFASQASDVKRALSAFEARFPHLASEAAAIGNFHYLLKDLGGKILPSGELDDHASLELKRIRRDMEKQRASILSSLRAFMRGQAEEAPSQEEIITIRGERFVVPIGASRKSRVHGIVHGASSSGQTVYIEPLETIDLNNELVGLREAEQREIQRILAEMTRRLREQASELAETAARIARLEVAFACGRFALDYDCVIPAVGGSGRLALKDARHPLLEAMLRRKRRDGAVPLSVVLEGEDHVLVISGPNTGGKTVALKTIGLLALMAISGLPVPATEAEFPLFDRILADIGDYQSIEESLSTFSAHLMNISSMMESATAGSLILLDELGSATDPEEAGALGVAVVDRFRSSGAFTVASTHHMAVKAYATNTPGVLSASMGFDEQTLQPTYRLEVGTPGNSSGLEIAQRLGLPTDVLERARQTLSSAHLEVEQFLSKLKDESAAAAQLKEELETRLASLAKEEKNWKENLRVREEKRAAEWERKLVELARSFEDRMEQKLHDVASRAETSGRRSVEPRKEAARVATRLREEAREELQQTVVSHLGDTEEAPAASKPVAVREPSVGDQVRLKGLRQPGVVRRIERGQLEVQIGSLRTKARLEDVVEVIPAAPATPKNAGGTRSLSVHVDRPISAPSEINVIGETADEARSRVDKFLDNAFVAQLVRVRVIHGSGKGILRQALAEMFSTHPHVEKFFPAPREEGGAGATIVELKA